MTVPDMLPTKKANPVQNIPQKTVRLLDAFRSLCEF